MGISKEEFTANEAILKVRFRENPEQLILRVKFTI